MDVYGFFPGGDPRQFTPDPEASTDIERQQHKRDCAAWERGERPNVNAKAPHWSTEPPSGEPAPDGVTLIYMHVTPAGYGLGTYSIDDAEYRELVEGPPEPHDYDPSCECWACYDHVVMARFRGESVHV